MFKICFRLVLYKQGPPFYHASYLVLIDNLSADTFTRKTDLPQRSFDWSSLIGLNRLTETAAKVLFKYYVLRKYNVCIFTGNSYMSDNVADKYNFERY